MPRARRMTHRVPNLSAPVHQVELNNYSGGMNNYIGNDHFPVRNNGTNMWQLAQDARIVNLGEYSTRKGFDFHSDPAGETIDGAITSTAGAASQGFNQTAWIAEPFTAASTGRLTRVDVRLKNDAGATGTVLIEIYSDSSDKPGTLLARSSIANNDVTSSYTYVPVRFPVAPIVTNGVQYWIVARVQASSSGDYYWSTTTAVSYAKASSDSGVNWSAALPIGTNFKEYVSTDSPIKGLFRAHKSDGTKVTLIAHGTVLYKVNNSTGALTSIKTGLDTNATDYRFTQVNDIVYYVNGYDGLRKWDFTTESQVNATDYTDITVHKGLLFLVDATDPAKIVWSNYLDYETFTSTDIQYVGPSKSGDAVAALASMNGYLLIRTHNTAYIFSGVASEDFSLDEAPDHKGTYGPNTSVIDGNFNYFLSSDGIYMSNGTEPKLLSVDNYEDIRVMLNKDTTVLGINKGRLYLWYRSEGADYNDVCAVYNLKTGSDTTTLESIDTTAYVCRAVSAFNDDDDLLVGSSIVGQAYWQEKDSNDYDNLGGDIQFDLRTHYFVGSSPSTKKSVRQWQSRVSAQDDDYTIKLDYAYDLRDNYQTWAAVDVQGSGSLWGSFTWGSATWGSTQEILIGVILPGDYNRFSLRYWHYAARQPHGFFGQTIRWNERRIR